MKPSTLFPLSLLLSTSSGAATPPALYPRRPASHRLSHTPPSAITGPVLSSSSKGKSAFSTASLTTGTVESTKAGCTFASPDNATITTASTTLTIPQAEMPLLGPTAGNQNGVYQASYWVGLDGPTSTSSSSCPGGGGGASLRAGVDTFWDTGVRTANAWYEWYPTSAAADFANMTLRQGDRVRIRVAADADGAGGVASVDRLAPGGEVVVQTVAHRFAGMVGADRLCLGRAGWVLEDLPLADRPEIPLPLANFTEVVFGEMEAGAGTVGYDLAQGGLEVFDIRLEAQGGRLTECGLGGDGVSVRCERVVEKS